MNIFPIHGILSCDEKDFWYERVLTAGCEVTPIVSMGACGTMFRDLFLDFPASVQVRKILSAADLQNDVDRALYDRAHGQPFLKITAQIDLDLAGPREVADCLSKGPLCFYADSEVLDRQGPGIYYGYGHNDDWSPCVVAHGGTVARWILRGVSLGEGVAYSKMYKVFLGNG